MKMVIISIRDVVANLYSPCSFVQSKGAALRSFGQEVNRADPNNQLYNHPKDFELYELGTFDDETATFEIKANPEQIAIARDFVVETK